MIKNYLEYQKIGIWKYDYQKDKAKIAGRIHFINQDIFQS